MSTESIVDRGISQTEFATTARAIESEIAKVIVGQSQVIRGVLIALLSGGHVLLEGVPGLGKTMLVRTLGKSLSLSFSRVQFTPDLMPSDITGTNVIFEDDAGNRSFRFQQGPVFANVVLADEINRATPKTQSALLEAMQEHRVTAGRGVHQLPEPFFVLATQNPIEMEGTYPLPEAQLDRFFFKLHVPFPSTEDLREIAQRTTSARQPQVGTVADGPTLLRMAAFCRELPMASPVLDYAVRLVTRTHPADSGASSLVKQYVRYGSSPRGLQAIVLGSKVRAILEGRFNVALEDVRAVTPAALRHRVLLNFEADAEGVGTDRVIAEVIETNRDR